MGRLPISATSIGCSRRFHLCGAGRAVAFSCVLLACSLTLSQHARAAAFTVVEAGHWAYDDLNVLIRQGVSDGFAGGLLGPGQTLTRYEVAMLVGESIHRMERLTESNQGDMAESEASLLIGRVDEVDLDRLLNEYTLARGEDTAFLDTVEPPIYRLVDEFGAELRIMGYRVDESAEPEEGGPSEPNLQDDGRIRGDSDESLYRLQLGSLYVSSRNRVVAEFGAPPRPLLRSFSFSKGGAAGSVQFEPVGPMGGALHTPRALHIASPWQSSSDGPHGSDGMERRRLEVSDSLSLGATWIELRETELEEVSREEELPDEELEEATVAGIEGSYVVSPTFLITGDYLRTEWLRRGEPVNDEGFPEEGTRADSYSLGAELRLGDVALNAGYRRVGDAFYLGFLNDSSGWEYKDGKYVNLGLSVQMGEVLLTTERRGRLSASDFGDDPKDPETLPPEDSMEVRAITRVGLEGSYSATRWRIGLRWEEEEADPTRIPDEASGGTRLVQVTEAALEYNILPNASASAAWELRAGGTGDGELNTEFGLQYDLSSQSTLLLGYKLVDFTDDDTEGVDESDAEATAKFTIRF